VRVFLASRQSRAVGRARLDAQPPRRPGLRSRPKRLLAFLPVAGAQLVRLERIQNAKRLLRVAADIEAVDGHVLDHIVGIDDEGGAIGDARIRGDDPESVGELLLVVRDPREVRRCKALVRLSPGVVDEIGIGRGSYQLSVAVFEVPRQVAIADDLGRVSPRSRVSPAGRAPPCWTGTVIEGSLSPTVSMRSFSWLCGKADEPDAADIGARFNRSN